jgi:hypothetical protein
MIKPLTKKIMVSVIKAAMAQKEVNERVTRAEIRPTLWKER